MRVVCHRKNIQLSSKNVKTLFEVLIFKKIDNARYYKKFHRINMKKII